MDNREEFEKWYQKNIGDLIRQPSGEKYIPEKASTSFESWQEQQKKIDALEATLKKQNESIATLIDVITEAAGV